MKWFRIDDGANQRLYNSACLQSVRWIPGTGLSLVFVNPADNFVVAGQAGVRLARWLLNALASDIVDVATDP